VTTPLVDPALDLLGLDPDGPAVVAIGGGHGLALTLEAVQAYAGSITAVVSVADDGGSSGRLTAGLGMPPPGDIRRCLLALTPEPSMWSELLGYRFPDVTPGPTGVAGHSLGNLMIAAVADLQGDFSGALATVGELLGSVGRVVPAATRAARLSARVAGRKVVGQVAIARARGPLEELQVGPEGIEAHPDALAAIRAADQIVLGPGSLVTSLSAALVVPGIAEAVMASRARRVFVLNLVTQDGETLGFDGAAHAEALVRLTGVSGPGGIVANRGPLVVPPGLEAVLLDGPAYGWDVIPADVVDRRADWPAHDPVALGRVLAQLV
jgi:uncharacterized cofD-like protein